MNLTTIAQYIGQLLAGIILALYFCKQYLTATLKQIDVSKKIPKQNKVDIAILESMEEVKEQLNADRIQVYEFHNGEHYANYRSALKLSCTYEVVRYGARALRDRCTHIPISCMPEFIKTITHTGKCICTDILTIKETMPSTYGFKSNLGVKAFYDIAIHNKNGDAIGFIAVQWDTKQRVNVNDAVIQKLVWFIEEQLNNIN